MDQIALEIQLTGDGFCDLTFRAGGDVATLRQLGDSPCPLEELIAAATALARDADPEPMMFDPEDGTDLTCVLDRRADRMSLRLTRTGQSAARESTSEFDVECAVDEFIAAVVDCAETVQRRYGADQYRRLWLAPFPADELSVLQSLIGGVARET